MKSEPAPVCGFSVGDLVIDMGGSAAVGPPGYRIGGQVVATNGNNPSVTVRWESGRRARYVGASMIAEKLRLRGA